MMWTVPCAISASPLAIGKAASATGIPMLALFAAVETLTCSLGERDGQHHARDQIVHLQHVNALLGARGHRPPIEERRVDVARTDRARANALLP